MAYEIVLHPLTEQEGGGWAASVPALPGCLGDGETPEEALHDVNSAIQVWVDTAKELGEPIPESVQEYSGKFTLRLPKSLHASLERRAKLDSVSLNQECVTLLAYQLGAQNIRTENTKPTPRANSAASVKGPPIARTRDGHGHIVISASGKRSDQQRVLSGIDLAQRKKEE